MSSIGSRREFLDRSRGLVGLWLGGQALSLQLMGCDDSVDWDHAGPQLDGRPDTISAANFDLHIGQNFEIEGMPGPAEHAASVLVDIEVVPSGPEVEQFVVTFRRSTATEVVEGVYPVTFPDGTRTELFFQPSVADAGSAQFTATFARLL